MSTRASATRGKQRPTENEVAMLRRISRGRLLVTMVDGRKVYAYEDGANCDQRSAQRLIRQGWVVPQDQGLWHGEEPQSYVVPDDRQGGLFHSAIA